jgi:hypothetical protein
VLGNAIERVLDRTLCEHEDYEAHGLVWMRRQLPHITEGFIRAIESATPEARRLDLPVLNFPVTARDRLLQA